ncbi:AbrB/MazE/SpoVT family DNA-binding domain-containing protein [Candidatus Poribacteria bacterium]|nr:AbrB/MazE/SpoVT family DNA-binding domain-containing protein [Candidatus Poribacteria bacterium]
MNTVTVRQRGEITLPKEVREACHVAPGAIFSVVPIGDVILLIPGHSRVGEAAAQLEHLRESAGLTVEQMMEGLDEERERYYQERYGN